MSLDEEVLEAVAKDGTMDYKKWPGMLEPLLERLDHIVHHDFPMPKVHPDLAQSFETQPTVLNSTHPTQETNSLPSSNKENLSPLQLRTPPPRPPVPTFPSSQSSERIPDSQPQTQAQTQTQTLLGPTDDALPPPLLSLLSSIKYTLNAYFTQNPPHTIQRLAELILRPTSHYRTLPAYLRAVDRVVSVSSGADIFPLPLALPIPGTIADSALANGIANGTTGGFLVDNSLGSDEALGGALLTPIPWLTDTAIPGGNRDPLDGSEPNPHSSPGSGSLVSSLGPVPTRESGAVTQGELIRQEQEAGVVPATHQHHQHQLTQDPTIATREGRGEMETQSSPPAEDGEEVPHARGPAVVGVEDMGLQDGRGVEMSLTASEGAAVSEEQNLRQAAASGRQGGGEEDGEKARDDGGEDMLLTDADAEAEVDGEGEPEPATLPVVSTEADVAGGGDGGGDGDGETSKDGAGDEKMGL